MESGQKGGPYYDAPDHDSSSSHHFAVILESIKILRLRKRRGGGIRTIRAYVRLYVDDTEIPWLCSPNDRDTTDPSWKPCVLFTASYSTPLKFVVERVGHFVGREELATIEGPLSQFAFRDDGARPASACRGAVVTPPLSQSSIRSSQTTLLAACCRPRSRTR